MNHQAGRRLFDTIDTTRLKLKEELIDTYEHYRRYHVGRAAGA